MRNFGAVTITENGNPTGNGRSWARQWLDDKSQLSALSLSGAGGLYSVWLRIEQ